MKDHSFSTGWHKAVKRHFCLFVAGMLNTAAFASINSTSHFWTTFWLKSAREDSRQVVPACSSTLSAGQPWYSLLLNLSYFILNASHGKFIFQHSQHDNHHNHDTAFCQTSPCRWYAMHAMSCWEPSFASKAAGNKILLYKAVYCTKILY